MTPMTRVWFIVWPRSHQVHFKMFRTRREAVAKRRQLRTKGLKIGWSFLEASK